MISRESLIDEIISSFKDVAYPGDDNITHCKEYCIDEFKDSNAHLTGVRWQDLPEKAYNEETGHTVLSITSIFTPEAYHYYLPAYMMVSLHGEDMKGGDYWPSTALEQYWKDF